MIDPTYIHTDGSNVVSGNCIVPDSHVTTITVQIQSLHGVSLDRLKYLIQKEFKVVDINKTNELIVVK